MQRVWKYLEGAWNVTKINVTHQLDQCTLQY